MFVLNIFRIKDDFCCLMLERQRVHYQTQILTLVVLRSLHHIEKAIAGLLRCSVFSAFFFEASIGRVIRKHCGESRWRSPLPKGGDL